jgi:hypothetical protein
MRLKTLLSFCAGDGVEGVSECGVLGDEACVLIGTQCWCKKGIMVSRLDAPHSLLALEGRWRKRRVVKENVGNEAHQCVIV